MDDEGYVYCIGNMVVLIGFDKSSFICIRVIEVTLG